MHWAYHIFGLDDASGAWYLFWSGTGAQLAIVGGAFSIYRRHNCHIHRCWRIAYLPVPGTAWFVCKKHHPGTGLKVTDLEIS